MRVFLYLRIEVFIIPLHLVYLSEYQCHSGPRIYLPHRLHNPVTLSLDYDIPEYESSSWFYLIWSILRRINAVEKELFTLLDMSFWLGSYCLLVSFMRRF